jgi:hypothetical protein
MGEHEEAANILVEGASPEIAAIIHNSMKGLDEALAQIAQLEERVAADPSARAKLGGAAQMNS